MSKRVRRGGVVNLMRGKSGDGKRTAGAGRGKYMVIVIGEGTVKKIFTVQSSNPSVTCITDFALCNY